MSAPLHSPNSLNSSSLQTHPLNPGEPYHIPSFSRIFTAAPMWVTSYVMGGFDFHKIKPMPKFLANCLAERSEEECEDDISDGGSVVFEDSDMLPASELPFDHRSSADDASKYQLPSDGYFANDGVVPLVSQFHPGDCEYVLPVFSFFSSLLSLNVILCTDSESSCIHHVPLKGTARLPRSHLQAKSIPKPGIWNVVTVEDAHHLSLMPLWMGSRRQCSFWYGLGEWLEEVDAARSFLTLRDAREADPSSKM